MTVDRWVLSDDGRYEHDLLHRWGDGPTLLWVMLNPARDGGMGRTTERCAKFARREGFAATRFLNLYAYRCTNPADLRHAGDPIGPGTDARLTDALVEAREADAPVVAGWGAHADQARVEEVLSLVPHVDWRCLGFTKSGQPRHPLYVRSDAPLVPLIARPPA